MQKMNEKEAKDIIYILAMSRAEEGDEEDCEALDIAMNSIEEIQQYRATGMTADQIKEMQMDYCAKGAVLEEYKAIGTPEEIEKALSQLAETKYELKKFYEIGTHEECREAVERMKPKKPICKEMPYIEEVGFNDEYYCPTCNNYVGFFTEGMGEPEQMECCNVCGQHIAKDWSE